MGWPPGSNNFIEATVTIVRGNLSLLFSLDRLAGLIILNASKITLKICSNPGILKDKK